MNHVLSDYDYSKTQMHCLSTKGISLVIVIQMKINQIFYNIQVMSQWSEKVAYIMKDQQQRRKKAKLITVLHLYLVLRYVNYVSGQGLGRISVKLNLSRLLTLCHISPNYIFLYGGITYKYFHCVIHLFAILMTL